MWATAVAGLMALVVFAAPPATAAERASLADRIDREVRAEMRAQQIPGLALAVLRGDRVLLAKGYGVATLEHPVKVGQDTRFQIGSIGKQFTATLVMLLARDGTLDLDAPLARYLPEVPASWHAVTLRLMLNHQAGIAQLTPPARDLLDLHHEYTDEEYLHLATSVPLDFEPGTSVSYSDTAYVLLGIVIGRVTKRFYGDLLAERVFRPLGMARTRILSDADIIPGRAAGYERDASGSLRNQAWVAAALNRTADGSLYSTVLDLARWDRELSRSSILPRAERDRMWRVDRLQEGDAPFYSYGYGWVSTRWRGHAVIEYDGNWQGFQAAMARYDDRRVTVIVLTNLALCRAQRIAHAVAGIVDPAVAPLRQLRKDSHEALTRDFSHLMEAEARGEPGAVATPEPAGFRLPGSWRAALRRELAAIGPVQSIGVVDESHADDRFERVYRVEAADMVDFFTVRYDASGAAELVGVYQEY